MPLKFDASVSFMFNESPWPERFAQARAAGFRAVEFGHPFQFERRELRAWLRDNGLDYVVMLAAPGDWAAGERGLAALPGREADFREGFLRALELGAFLEVGMIHPPAGTVPAGVEHAQATETFRTNMRFAAEEAAKARLPLVIEPVNRNDNPGFFIPSVDAALTEIEAIGAEIGLLVDIFHAAREGLDLVAELSAAGAHLTHVQIADLPGRHEPGTGDIAFDAVFSHLEALAYSGWVGLEYRPKTTTAESLTWLDAYR